MISLALFGLIALAGLGLVDALMGIRDRTEGRLERMAEIQRAMYVVDNDLTQVTTGQIKGDTATLTFSRPLAAEGGLPVQVHYQLGGGTLLRGLRGRSIPTGEQRVLQGIGSLRWSYYTPGGGWIDHWPPSPEATDSWPVAISADILLAPGGPIGGSLRRVTLLPARP